MAATREATVAVREKVMNIAAHMMEASPDDLEIAEGVVSVRGTPSKSVTISDVAKQAFHRANELPDEMEGGLEATVRFRPTQFPTWSNATHICVVEIDGETWLPEVKRYIVSEDCGRMINPMVVEGQIFGGVVQGMGGVLLEDFVYDEEGNPLTTTFMDYLPPTTTEVPEIEVGHIETVSTTNPGGYKGMGEGGRNRHRTRPSPTRCSTRSGRSASRPRRRRSAPSRSSPWSRQPRHRLEHRRRARL